ncbi:hypothetical protein QBC37DRAFT_297257 [Rhypophila decipiens]|uniref:Uncharacterized protein n=1 Tax=Rhypophila decipiens TaxID=261697 RepID=A0AAN7B259_9PEZI|nr:hypothetical protein QBC37DRAFT_297257 [Rhypophila decipiens]
MLPLCHTHPIRAELGMEAYSRSFFVNEWDRLKGNMPLSLPLLTFIDGFGLFSNTRRSLVGYYVTPANFTAHDRRRRYNTFPILFSPRGSNFNDVVDKLRVLLPLDKGNKVVIKGQEHLLCAFTLCFTEDMPQQSANSSCLQVL